MRNKRRTTARRQRGFSLVLVLFLLVVVSLLAASMMQLNRGSANAVGLEMQSTRALFAAESGAQIAAMKLFPLGGSTQTCAAATLTQAFSAGGLNNCSASVACTAVTLSNPARTIFTIRSTGTCSNGGGDYARRQITVGLWDLQ